MICPVIPKLQEKIAALRKIIPRSNQNLKDSHEIPTNYKFFADSNLLQFKIGDVVIPSFSNTHNNIQVKTFTTFEGNCLNIQLSDHIKQLEKGSSQGIQLLFRTLKPFELNDLKQYLDLTQKDQTSHSDLSEKLNTNIPILRSFPRIKFRKNQINQQIQKSIKSEVILFLHPKFSSVADLQYNLKAYKPIKLTANARQTVEILSQEIKYLHDNFNPNKLCSDDNPLVQSCLADAYIEFYNCSALAIFSDNIYNHAKKNVEIESSTSVSNKSINNRGQYCLADFKNIKNPRNHTLPQNLKQKILTQCLKSKCRQKHFQVATQQTLNFQDLDLKCQTDISDLTHFKTNLDLGQSNLGKEVLQAFDYLASNNKNCLFYGASGEKIVNLHNPDLLQDFVKLEKFLNSIDQICSQVLDPEFESNSWWDLSDFKNMNDIVTLCQLAQLRKYSYDYFQVEIGYKDLNKYLRSETEVDTWDRLLIDISSQLGFWLGFSFITLFEVLLYLRLLFSTVAVYLIQKIRRQFTRRE